MFCIFDYGITMILQIKVYCIRVLTTRKYEF